MWYKVKVIDNTETGAILTFTKLELRAEIEDRLRQLAEVRQQPADALIGEAIEQYVEREENRARLRRDAMTAWNEYELTGEHVTTDEADAWLARLEAGEDAVTELDLVGIAAK